MVYFRLATDLAFFSDNILDVQTMKANIEMSEILTLKTTAESV